MKYFNYISRSIAFTLTVFLCLQCANINAQSPSLFNYQAIAEDASGSIYKNQGIDLILYITKGQNGPVLYEESHSTTTSNHGIFSLQIGGGQVLSGSFNAIDWSQDQPWLETEVDFGTGTFQNIGTVQLVSVPFAQHAETATNVDDADADPQNEIQQLSLNNHLLSISQGNQIDLSPVTSPWVSDASGIKYEQGLVRILDANSSSEVAIDGNTIYGSKPGVGYELTPESIVFGREANDWGSNMDAVAVDLYNPKGEDRTFITRDSMTISEAACSTVVKPGLIRLEDTLGIRRTRYSKDSLYFLNAPTTLAIPDETTVSGYGIKVKTQLAGLNTRLSSAQLDIHNGPHHTELSGLKLRMYNTLQPIQRNQVRLEPDTFEMINQAAWINARMTSSNRDGGRLNMYGPSGAETVFLGTNPDTFLTGPIGGALLLKDKFERNRVTASTFGNQGYLDVNDPELSASLFPGSVSVNLLDSIDTHVSLLTTTGNFYHNKELQTGQLDLFAAAEGNTQEIIARIGGDGLNESAGRFCLYNNDKDFEKVCILADNVNGGEINLFGKTAQTFYAGGFAGKGSAHVSDLTGLPKAIMKVGDFGQGQFVSQEGDFSVINDQFTEVVRLDEYSLFFSDSAGRSSAFIGKDIIWPNVGVQQMYGRNGSANVYIGFDQTEGELGPSGNFGAVEALDHNSQRRAWLSGVGQIGGQTLRIVDSMETDKIAASVDAGNAGVMEFYGQNGSKNISLNGGLGNLGNIQVFDHNSTIKAGIGVDLFSGDGVVFGDVKNFRMQHPTDADKEIWYASLEGPEAGAYHRGTAQLINGEAFIPFPDHFKQVCNPETMTVQLTPRHWDTYGLAVVEIKADGMFIKELKGGTGDFSFDWEVKGVRKGYEDFQPVLTKAEVAKKFSFPNKSTK